MCTQPGHRSDSTSTKAKFNFVPSHGSPIFMYADRSNRNGFPRFIVFRFLRTKASGGCDVCRRIFRSTWATDTSPIRLLSDFRYFLRFKNPYSSLNSLNNFSSSIFDILLNLEQSILDSFSLDQRYVSNWMINGKLWAILIFLGKEILF